MHFVILAVIVVVLLLVAWLATSERRNKQRAKLARERSAAAHQKFVDETTAKLQQMIDSAKAGDTEAEEDILSISARGYFVDDTMSLDTGRGLSMPRNESYSVTRERGKEIFALQRLIRSKRMVASVGTQLVTALAATPATNHDDDIAACQQVVDMNQKLRATSSSEYDHEIITSFLEPLSDAIEAASTRLVQVAGLRLEELIAEMLTGYAPEAYTRARHLLFDGKLQESYKAARHGSLRFPPEWREVVTRHVDNPMIEAYGPDNLGGPKASKDFVGNQLALMAAEAIRAQDSVLAKLVLAYARDKVMRQQLGDALYTEIVKLVERVNAQQSANAP